MSQPLLSIGMIVKNEERCLEKCLKALEPLRQAIPCELVIADTGSTDKTKEIATRYADILFDFTWINDFSAARNAVMDKCTGKWYLTVDADEYLSSSTDELVDFLTGPLGKKNIHASIIQRNFKNTDLSGIYSDFNAIRMVRMDTKKRYKGAIHETFPFIDLELTHILTNTIFDHDGYTPITPEHLREKAKRNLEILEKKLQEEPDNIRAIVQCLEVCGQDMEKRKYYSDYAVEKLKKASKNDTYIDGFGPSCTKEVIRTKLILKEPDTKDFADWAFKRFPKSFDILIDINYLLARNSYSTDKFEDCVKFCKDYLRALNSYTTSKKVSTFDAFVSSLEYVHEYFRYEIQTLLANALIKIERTSEALKYLKDFDLSEADDNSITNWFSAILSTKVTDEVLKTASTVIDDLFKKHYGRKTTSNANYEFVISIISNTFSCIKNPEHDFNVFSSVSGTIGLSVKIANAKSKAEAESLLNKIENWEEFMPLALKNALLLKCDLPEKFYVMPSSRLSVILSDLTGITEEIADVIVNHYCKDEKLKNFPEISFAFNLLLNSLFNTNIALSKELKLTFLQNFCFVAECYLNSCYNETLLNNEDCIKCLPVLHLFSWYLVKATKQKEQNPLEYIKTLRSALNKIPQAKQIIEFLIEEFQKEEELKKQDQIKKASPELLQMAEQLKTMLKALPPDSPELLAIKQSPVYQNLAFLIEN